MKNTFKFAAIAVAAMAFAVACNNAPEATEDTVIDTPAVETVAEEMPVEDTVAVVEEAPAKPAKKAEKTVQKNDASKVTISTDNGSASFTVNQSNKKSNTDANDASKVTINADNGNNSLTIKKN